MSAHSPKSRVPEAIAAAGALLAAVSVFLPWYSTDPASRASNIDGVRGDLSMWTVHEAMRYVLLVLLVLIAIMALATLLRGETGLHEPGMVLGVNALGIVLYFGFIYRPGDPMQTISLRYGFFLALAGIAVPLVVAALRAKAGMKRSASAIGSRA
jgi:hypothetical protein